MAAAVTDRTVAAILDAHGIAGPWHSLPAHGVANTIYATADVVLRIATDHEQAESDARTESVAAPAAYAAGIRTPRLLAFDDSRTLTDRPYTIWERVNGATVGTFALDPDRRLELWQDVGRELARLHTRVLSCADPNGWLDSPSRVKDLARVIHELRDGGRLRATTASAVLSLVRDLEPHVQVEVPPRFVHDDLHAWNVMCSREGELLAIIDWGDAGWGDPSIDFGYLPHDVVAVARAGYVSIAPETLGPNVGARIAWDQLHHALERALYWDMEIPDVGALRRLAED